MDDPAMRQADAAALAEAWLGRFGAALASGDAASAAALFDAEGHWRDILTLGWDIRTLSGRDAIAAALAAAMPRARVAGLAPLAGWPAPRRATRAGVACIEAFFGLETAAGPVEAAVRLVETPEGPKAWILTTLLAGLPGHPPPEAVRHANPEDYARQFGGENWADRRRRAIAFEDREPAVLVVGAGQAGLAIAARLGALGVDTLVVDREARIGDNWRRRYHALTLHNEVHVNHLPYLNFPPTWPVFIPKDKLANWFEFYADAMELNVWTETTLESGRRDADDQGWEVVLRRADGSARLVRPRHIVFATGVSAIPVMPDLPGLTDFAGTVMHSGAYDTGAAWKDKPVLVLGTGNSAHDVAQDLHASGARVTMIQRSPTHIVSIEEAQRVYALYAEGMPLAACDLLATATPLPVLRRAYQHATAVSKRMDSELHARLAARGFRLSDGIEGTGFQMLYLQRGGGYYFNVGCSDLIADGAIGLLQFDDIARFEAGGARMKDGTLREAALLVLATGYLNQQEMVRRFLGEAVAERIGPVWGFGPDGELRNMWRPTPQKGLWFTAGSLAQCRIYSRPLALRIKAEEMGLV
ncbi:MAG: NAD(P)/FAD-dependent oxidoreductase [Rubritepida sp.]|nr:NAD(P)/FAD-dependent oxidoreductase [Rubritepida sp.]